MTRGQNNAINRNFQPIRQQINAANSSHMKDSSSVSSKMLLTSTLLVVGLFAIANATSNARDIRFTDVDFALNRPTNVPNPFATKGVPSDFKDVQKLLAAERATSQLYDTVWIDAEYVYQRKKKTLPPEYFKATTPKECYIAVIAYTLDTQVTVNGSSLQLYRDFNNRFRGLSDESSWNNFPYRSFYYLLTIAIPGIKNRPDPSSTSWRGIRNIHFSPLPKVGDTFYFDYFASTSTDRSTAESFIGSDGTLVQLNGGAHFAMGIDAYSDFSEQEVLVFPRNKFKVKSFQRHGSKDVIVIQSP